MNVLPLTTLTLSTLGEPVAFASNAARQCVDVLLGALAERHPDLGDHADGVVELAVGVGSRLGVAGAELEQLGYAAALHDVGKIAVPARTLGKPGPLDDAEWELMRLHTVIGERIVAAAPALAPAAALVRWSHERWDGTGYPDGLTGWSIPLGARIVAACDAYDAMLSARPYHATRTRCEALTELQRCAGTQFDPRVVDALAQVLIHSTNQEQ
jgi:two-component system, cell cycle response regulator